jgi:branched-chain amino acid transport system permease protein
VAEVATRIIVLHQGRIVMDGSFREVAESELVRTIYAGNAPAAHKTAQATQQASRQATEQAARQGAQPATPSIPPEGAQP